MRMNELPKRFYRLLYFSPRPEDAERVCVAVLLHDSEDTYLDFDEKLEKAHCFAPDYTKAALSFILETVRKRAQEVAAGENLIEISPQFHLSAPRALLRPVDEKVRSILRQRYILKPKSAEHRHRERGLGKKIDLFLQRSAGIPLGGFRRQVSAIDLFGPDVVRELPTDLIPKPVSRAVIAEGGVVLIDGVDLHVSSIETLVSRVNRVARTFWQYKKVQEMSQNPDDRKLIRAALVFDGIEPTVETSLKWRLDYTFHQFEKDAEIRVKIGSQSEEEQLISSLRGLVPPSLHT